MALTGPLGEIFSVGVGLLFPLIHAEQSGPVWSSVETEVKRNFWAVPGLCPV